MKFCTKCAFYSSFNKLNSLWRNIYLRTHVQLEFFIYDNSNLYIKLYVKLHLKYYKDPQNIVNLNALDFDQQQHILTENTRCSSFQRFMIINLVYS